MNVPRPPRTPVTPQAWAASHAKPPVEAVLDAWCDPGPNPFWHRMQQETLRANMPLLAHALDRLAQERGRPVPPTTHERHHP